MGKTVASLICASGLAFVMMGAPALARVTLEQCNKQIDGAFKPVLIVHIGTSSTTVPAGTNGLTSIIILSKSRAIAWARQQFDIGTVPISYGQCGMGRDDDRRNR